MNIRQQMMAILGVILPKRRPTATEATRIYTKLPMILKAVSALNDDVESIM